MQKVNPNYAKKLAALRHKDEICRLKSAGKSIREITKIINRRLSHLKPEFRTTLSKSKMHELIKKYCKKTQGF